MGLRGALRKLGEVQARHASVIFVIAIIFTGFMAVGLPNIRVQTDLSKELPEDLPVIELNDEVRDKFGDVDLFITVVELDKQSSNGNDVVDIRDPRVMRMVVELHNLLKKENEITKVRSVASFFRKGIPYTLEEVKARLEEEPDASRFFNKDFSATIVMAYADVGASERRTKELTNVVYEDIYSIPLPPGVKVSVTGMPIIRVTLMDLLVEDASYTMSIAALIILALLLVISRPFTRGILIFLPLCFALIWTLGTMGLLDIPLSIATVGIGAMILGLGVEYGVFFVTVYKGEREKGKSQLESLSIAVPGVGSAIFGSAVTTMAGFLALLLATMPMIQHLGFALALGIFYCLIAALVVNPAFIVIEERFMEKRGIKE